MRDGRRFTVEVRSDGDGLVSHAGSALLAGAADKTGLTGALSGRLWGLRSRRGGHDPGRVVRDLAVMLADGGECLSDICLASRSSAHQLDPMAQSLRLGVDCGGWWPDAPRGGLSGRRLAPADPRN